MTSTPHTNCSHPATKAARAKCRKERAVAQGSNRALLEATLISYYDNSGDIEEIMGTINLLATRTGDAHLTAASRGYYGNDLEIEEVIGIAAQALNII